MLLTMSRNEIPTLSHSYCAARLPIFRRQHDFKLGMIVREKAGCALLRKRGNGFFVALELRDDEPLFDLETRNVTAGFGMPLDLVVGKVDEDGDQISLWEDHRCFEPMPEEGLRRR
jgi:hypothetical protein